jgi:hypothetical protein
VADENKIQGYVPLYNVWVLKHLAPGHVGTTESDVVSNIVLKWFGDNQRLIRMLGLTEADYQKATKKKSSRNGPQGIVPPPESPLGPKAAKGQPVGQTHGGERRAMSRTGHPSRTRLPR